MDGLSAATSIVALLQLTSAVIGYLNDIKNAPKECQQCTIEVSNTQNLLINLRYRLEQGQYGDPWFTAARALNIPNGPLDQYKQALEQLRSRVEIQDGVQKLKRRLLWKFSKEEVTSILARIERLKSLAIVALEMDHFKLSQAIREDITTVRDTIPILQDDIAILRNTQSLQWDAQQLQQLQAIRDWLSPLDFLAQQNDIMSQKQPGTGQWFLNSEEFKGWLKGSDKTLFCPGIPGAGKTMMAGIAIDHLCQVAPSENIGVAYIYCKYKAQSDQSVSALLAAILKQLVQGQLSIPEPVLQLYNRHSTNGTRPSLDEIFTALQSACTEYSRVHVVVDALDECTNQEGARGRLLAKLRELQHGSDIRLMVTARFIPDIEQQFRSASKLEVRASDEDVGRYVAGQMHHLPKCIQHDEEMKSQVQVKLVQAVDGMFLLARLYIDSLLDKRTKKKVISTLDNLARGSAALGQAYSEAIERIDGQPHEDRKLARHVLSWITYAQRLLTTQELCHALAVEPGDTELDEDNVPDIEDVVLVCAGLVTIDKESNIIRLVHYTTQEYFERTFAEWNPTGAQGLASNCLTYLSLDPFRLGSCDADEEFEERLRKYIFLDYAARHWAAHVRPVEATVSKQALEFLQNDALVSCSTQVMSVLEGYRLEGYSQIFPQGTTGLHLSARLGLGLLTQILVTDNNKESLIDVDSKDDYGQTPLSLAAKEGHETIVKFLVETGKVDVDSKARSCQTPLLRAAQGGHAAVVKLLVETGKVDVNSKAMTGQTPLTWAAWGGHEAVVKLLVETDKVNIDSKDNYGQTPLMWATLGGHEAVVKLLVETGKVDVDWKDMLGTTPLMLAADEGHKAVVKLLVETGKVDIDSKDKDGQTPLLLAAQRGYMAVVKLLVETGKVDIDSKNKDGQTPLLLAARGGHKAVVKLLQQSLIS